MNAMEKPKHLKPSRIAKFINKNQMEKLQQLLNRHDYGLALQLAVINQKHQIAQWLLSIGTPINCQYAFKDTLLHMAVENNDEKMVRLLIEHDADLNIQNSLLKTPLQTARFHSHSALIDILEKAAIKAQKSGQEKIALLDAKHTLETKRLMLQLNFPSLQADCQKLLLLNRENIALQQKPDLKIAAHGEQENKKPEKCIIF